MTYRAIREAMKDAIRALPPMHVTNTDYVPQAKRRPDAVIDRAAALLAIEHVTLPEAAAPDPVASPPDEVLAVEWINLIERAMWALPWRDYAMERDLAVNIVRRLEELLGPAGGLAYIGAVATPAPLDVERLADYFTWFHIRVAGYCSESHKPDASACAAAYALEGQPVAEEPRPDQEATP